MDETANLVKCNVIVDARNLLFRVSWTHRSLGYESVNGWQSTGGVYGFLKAVVSITKFMPNATIFIAWDDSSEARKKVIDTYKAERKDDDMRQMVQQQEPILRYLLTFTAWRQCWAPGWEADDVIATLCKHAVEPSIILSSDRDLFQCLRGKHVTQWRPKPGGKYDVWTAPRLFDEWGVTPEQIPHVKALSGDSSDGFKGVPGIGEKTACKLIAEWGAVDRVLQAARDGEIKGKKGNVIAGHAEYVQKCWEVAIAQDEATLLSTEPQRDHETLRDLLTTMKITSIEAQTLV